jgi:peptidoglycan-associated lipoprotein
MATKAIYLLCAAVLITLAGCTGGPNKNGAGAATGSDSDSVNGIPLPPRQEGVSFLDPSVSKSRFSSVHFAFDSFEVSPGDAGTVQAVASFMKSAPNSVIIAGFTDERGTAGYNRALGEKRAGAVREALINAGVSPARIQTVSFGAEMPVDPASNESAWAANRRAEFGVTRQ